VCGVPGRNCRLKIVYTGRHSMSALGSSGIKRTNVEPAASTSARARRGSGSHQRPRPPQADRRERRAASEWLQEYRAAERPGHLRPRPAVQSARSHKREQRRAGERDALGHRGVEDRRLVRMRAEIVEESLAENAFKGGLAGANRFKKLSERAPKEGRGQKQGGIARWDYSRSGRRARATTSRWNSGHWAAAPALAGASQPQRLVR